MALRSIATNQRLGEISLPGIEVLSGPSHTLVESPTDEGCIHARPGRGRSRSRAERPRPSWRPFRPELGGRTSRIGLCRLALIAVPCRPFACYKSVTRWWEMPELGCRSSV